MVQERIEQEAVPVSEIWKDALGRADRALRRMSKGLRAAAFVGLIVGITTTSQAKEDAIVSPVTLPAEGKTSLEVSAAKIPPEIVVSPASECTVEGIKISKRFTINTEKLGEILQENGLECPFHITTMNLPISLSFAFGFNIPKVKTEGIINIGVIDWVREIMKPENQKIRERAEKYGYDFSVAGRLKGEELNEWAIAHESRHLIQIQKGIGKNTYERERDASLWANKHYKDFTEVILTKTSKEPAEFLQR